MKRLLLIPTLLLCSCSDPSPVERPDALAKLPVDTQVAMVYADAVKNAIFWAGLAWIMTGGITYVSRK